MIKKTIEKIIGLLVDYKYVIVDNNDDHIIGFSNDEIGANTIAEYFEGEVFSEKDLDDCKKSLDLV